MMKLHRLLTIISIIGVSAVMGFAETVTRGRVTIQYEPMDDGGIKVINVWNKAEKQIDIKIDGRITTINPGGSAQPNQYASKLVRYDCATGGDVLWRPTYRKEPAIEETAPVAATTSDNIEKDKEKKKEAPQTTEPRDSRNQREQSVNRARTKESVSYLEKLNQDEFFGMDAMTAFTGKVENLCWSIESSKNKQQFIIDNDVELFLAESEKEINEKKATLADKAQEIVSGSNVEASSQASTMAIIVETLSNRLKTREDAYNRLHNMVSNVNDGDRQTSGSLGEIILNYGIIAVIVIILCILTIVAIRSKKKKQDRGARPTAQTATDRHVSPDNPAIVVRRRTTSILKKQCIDDIKDNPAYMVIKSSDFTVDSAVKRIYIKNSCIKDVYNLYAEDLRNSENPKEDGCMVLGRWVHDEIDHTYDISLEEVVFPGDDAVFKEYELNFGGKIKLRIAEKLRKLRRETNLQYDLVCWIHSHPGLGVFFSNSDDNVQMQLKHSQHPNFLIAFVVDILTSDQETGIFTFRKDGSMNSKGDLTKMYSLEEMYKWALQSERNTFSHDNYFNIIENAKLKMPTCKGVELNNSSIIDMTQIVIEAETGIVGWAVGTTVEIGGCREFVVSSIVRDAEKPGTGVIGCLISMTHMSFPTIQRLIARYSVNLSFVMVYSSKQMSLTTLPVINGELLSDEQFYGDVNIDDLKIWTRRKR